MKEEMIVMIGWNINVEYLSLPLNGGKYSSIRMIMLRFRWHLKKNETPTDFITLK